MREQGVKALLATGYFDRKAIELVAGSSGAAIVEMAHQAGSRPGTDDYISFVDTNVRAVAKALAP